MRTLLLVIFTFIFLHKSFCQTILPFREGDKWFYVSKSLKPISNKTYSFIFPYNEKRAIVQQNKKYGVIDDKEKTIIPFEYDTIAYYKPYFNCIKNEIEINIDENGEIDSLDYFGRCGGIIYTARSCFAIEKNNKILLLNFSKNDSIPDTLSTTYDELIEFNDAVAAVKIGKKWGIVNCAGKVITDFMFDSVSVVEYNSSNQDQLSQYFTNGQMGFLNCRGKIVTSAKFKDFIFSYNEFSLVLTNDDRLVYIDNKGREYYK